MFDTTILKGGEDFQCPYCGEGLEWDENRLYSFTKELVKCYKCREPFYAKQLVKTTYKVYEDVVD